MPSTMHGWFGSNMDIKIPLTVVLTILAVMIVFYLATISSQLNQLDQKAERIASHSANIENMQSLSCVYNPHTDKVECSGCFKRDDGIYCNSPKDIGIAGGKNP